jgi:hypothetical protein
VDATGSGLYIVVGFSTGGVDPSSSATRELVRYKEDPEDNQMLTAELDTKVIQ